MVPDDLSSTKSPTKSSTEENSSFRDGNEEQRGNIPNALGRTPVRALTGLERVRLRRLQNQARAEAEGSLSNSDPSPLSPLSRSERNGRLSGPYGHSRDMGMGGAGMNGNGMDMNMSMRKSLNGFSLPPAPSDNAPALSNNVGSYPTPRKEQRGTKSKSAFAENQEQLDREIGEALMEEELETDDYLYKPRTKAESYGSRKKHGKLDSSITKRNSKKNREATTQIHRPKKEKGARAIGPIDTNPAILGHHDPSKFIISFATEKPKPGHAGHWIPSKDVTYDLNEITNNAIFDFDNPMHIKRINVWRRQIFGRNFPKQRKTRAFWLESERDYVVHLVRTQLQQGGGARVKWNRLANEYNERFWGRRQYMGEKLLTQGRQNLGILLVERPAPWRTSAAIQGMAAKWRDVREMIRDAENGAVEDVEGYEGTKSDSESEMESADEEEKPDPNPEPEPGVTPRKYGTYGKRNVGRGKATSKAKNAKVEVEVKSEEDDDDDMEMEMDDSMADSDDEMLV